MRSFVIFLLVLTTNIRPLRSEINDISLGIGLIDENIKTYQTNTAGDRNFAEYRILIESQLYYDIFDDDQWFIVPTLAFQFPKTTEESSIKKYRFITGAAVGYKFSDMFMLRAGGAFYFTHLSSTGGSTNLPNGNGTTDFPLPPESATAVNLTTNLAAEFFLEEVSFKSELLVFNLTDSLKRAFTYSLTVHYHFESIL